VAQLGLAGFRTRVERDEDYETSLLHDEDWWLETEEAFLAEIRESVPPRLLADLARAPLVDERHLNRLK
jgi:hypothetical protein